MNRPETIDGIPLMASTKILTVRRSRERLSLRKTAHDTPNGNEMSRARPTCSSVPTMACSPPPAVAGSLGVIPLWVWAKNPRRSAGSPLTST